jgi:hypothetical protein
MNNIRKAAQKAIRNQWSAVKLKLVKAPKLGSQPRVFNNPLYVKPSNSGGENPLQGLPTTVPQNTRREQYRRTTSIDFSADALDCLNRVRD